MLLIHNFIQGCQPHSIYLYFGKDNDCCCNEENETTPKYYEKQYTNSNQSKHQYNFMTIFCIKKKVSMPKATFFKILG